MNTQEILEYWSNKGEPLFTYKLPQLDSLRLLEETIKYLTQIGLPRESAPALSFDLWDRITIPTPNQVLGIDFEVLNDYLMIGSNGSGDPICIDLNIVNRE